MEADQKVEASLRRYAKSLGYYFKKSRARSWSNNNQQKYALLTIDNRIVLGEAFDASLQDIEKYLDAQLLAQTSKEV